MVKYLTKEGLENLKKELNYLKSVKRKEIAERLEKAIAFGDLSENAAYSEAKEAQSFAEGRILELTEIIANAVLIKEGVKRGIVDIGSSVRVRKDGDDLSLKIVGVNEANPAEGRISNESPIGAALLGKREGDEVEVMTPGGKMKCKILKIE